MTLLRSQIECLNCHEVIASIHRHDFRTCGCGKTSIDGGRDYLRVVGGPGWINRSLSVEPDLSRQEAARVLHVYKALVELAEDHEWCATSGITNWFNHVALARPVMNFPLAGYPHQTILKWLGMLESAGAVERRREGRCTVWRPLLPWAAHPDA